MSDVMDQWVASAARSDEPGTGDRGIRPATETPLHHAGFAALAGQRSRRLAGEAAGLVLSEKPLHGLLCLRADPQRVDLAAAVTSVLALPLPSRLQSAERDDRCLRWMAPDEWWLSCAIDEAFELERQLRTALNGHYAIVNQSGGYTTLLLSGEAALPVLMKSTGYDVHPRHFPPGKVVRTLFAKTAVSLRCLDTAAYEIIVRRSFADYLWLWLQAASEEHGLRIEA